MSYGWSSGVAEYAGKYGEYFGRIELIVVGNDGRIKRLDVNKEAIREKVLPAKETAYLEALFEGQV
jgi:hypothetical protein